MLILSNATDSINLLATKMSMSLAGLPEGADYSTVIWETSLVRYHGFGALVFLLWDVMITFGDEVEYIWRQPVRSPTKWVFLFTRYFGLSAQTRLLSINLSLNLGAFSVSDCRKLYASQVAFGGVLMACIQSILMLRVYALYVQDRRIAYAMIALLVAEVSSMPGIIHLTTPTNTGTMCMKPIMIHDIVLFGVSALLPQLLVLGLTLLKFFSGLRAGWGKIPIVSRLVHGDVILVSVIESLLNHLVSWVIITASLTRINTIFGYIGYSWLLSIIPSVGCRVVIHMQRVADEVIEQPTRERGSAVDVNDQLTSCLLDTDTFSIPYLTDGTISPSLPDSPSRLSSSSKASNEIKVISRDSPRGGSPRFIDCA